MADLVAEAIDFYNKIGREDRVDLISPLAWSYVLVPLDQTRVEEALDLLRQQGFASVVGTYDEQSGQLAEVCLSEAAVHTVDSFAERIRGLVDFARQHHFELTDWSIDDEGESAAEAGAGQQHPSAPKPSGRITRQEIGAFACKVIALWLFVEAAMDAGGAISVMYGLITQRPLAGPSLSTTIYWGLLPLHTLLGGVVLWCLAGVIGRRMVRRDPSPIVGIDFDAGQLLGVALVVAGIFLVVSGVKSFAYLVYYNWNYLDSLSALWGRSTFHARFWNIVIQFAAGFWLLFGFRGIVALLGRLRSERLANPPDDGAK